MTDRPRRARRQTAECPKGVGGVSPFPLPGCITALRVLHTGREIELDRDTREFAIGADGRLFHDRSLLRSMPYAVITRHRDDIVVESRGLSLGKQWSLESLPSKAEYQTADRLIGYVGHAFSIGAFEVLPLDDELRRVSRLVGLYCKRDAHAAVSDALFAVRYHHVLGLQTGLGFAVVDLARQLHAETARRDYKFARLDCGRSFGPPSAIDDWCNSIGCGTVFVDLAVHACRMLPKRMIQNLLSHHYHLWPIIAMPTPAVLYKWLARGDLDYDARRRLGGRCIVEVAPPLRLLNGGDR